MLPVHVETVHDPEDIKAPLELESVRSRRVGLSFPCRDMQCFPAGLHVDTWFVRNCV